MYYIGVDIGGTNIKIGLLNEQLQIVQRVSVPFPHTGGADTAVLIAQQSRDLLLQQGCTDADLAAVGVIVPGSIDPTGKVVIHAHNLDFHGVPLHAHLREQFPGKEVYLANDADGACLAELGCGALHNSKTAVLLTLGTGVGGGLILGGKMFNGGKKQGVELGHMPLVFGGEACTCGNSGCIEAYCSATALARDGRRAMAQHPDSLLAVRCSGDSSQIDAKLVIDCAKEGDPTALDVFDRYVDHLGSACIAMIHLLDPEIIAIGGGVCHAGEFLFRPLRENVAKKSFFSDFASIVPAALGNDAGMIGAAMLGMNP